MYAPDAVTYEVQDQIGTVTLNRPEVFNAFNKDFATGLVAALRQAEEDPGVRAVILTGPSVGVGLRSLTENWAVTVQGGPSSPACTIRWWAVAQFMWQSRRVPIIPPFSIPSKASWCFSGCHSTTYAPSMKKLRMRSPFSFEGPHPKQALLGAYLS